MYDIIGDIHGHADKLEILLQKLVNDKLYGIRTIEVLEVWSNHPDLNVIEPIIMFEDFEGIWDILIPATFDFPVECDGCPAD